MNTLNTRFRCAVLLAWLGAGGYPCQQGVVAAPAQSGVATQPAAAAAVASRLQLAIDGLSDLHYQHEPRRRPRLISEAKPDRVNWLRAVLKRGYMASGHTNAAWDSIANDALRSYVTYSRLAATRPAFQDLTNEVGSAIALGCTDPFIHYMQVRYAMPETNAIGDSFALASVAVFRDVFSSEHHPVLKFMAGFRAAEAAREAEPNGKRGVLNAMVTACLEDIARDTNAPEQDVFETARMWYGHSRHSDWAVYVMSALEGLLKETWGKEEDFFRLVGEAEIERAWNARGNGFADKVSDKGWEDFKDHLNKATISLETAWAMRPTNALTAYMMMRVELGQGQSRERMEKWFRRAMQLAPNYYDAATLMGYYLEPRWYGTERDALDFGRACVSSTNWGGTVPLVLANMHRSLAGYYRTTGIDTNHWARPEVWKDVKSSYERFFELNPSAYGYHHDYARDAYCCGQYAEFLSQTKLFLYRTNFAFFGGEKEFTQMLQHASKAVSGEQ